MKYRRHPPSCLLLAGLLLPALAFAHAPVAGTAALAGLQQSTEKPAGRRAQDAEAGAETAPEDADAGTDTLASDAGPGTGDPVVDARMADISVYAGRFPDAFVDELVRYFDAPRALIEERLAEGTDGGDLYYACALARVTGRPCRGVIEAWQGAGGNAAWESVARRFGVEPGSERAGRIRTGMADSYARWARPLPGG